MVFHRPTKPVFQPFLTCFAVFFFRFIVTFRDSISHVLGPFSFYIFICIIVHTAATDKLLNNRWIDAIVNAMV